MLLREFKMMV